MATRQEIAANWDLWREYVDPAGVDTQEWFERTSIEEKLRIQEECFGAENK